MSDNITPESWPDPGPPGGGQPQAGQQPPGNYPGQPPWPPPPVGSYPPMAGPQYSPVNATMILILGILGLTVCGVCGPIAWIMGNQAMRTLDQYGDPLAQRGMVNGGRICGIVGTVLVGVVLVFYAIAFAFGLIGALSHPGGS